VDQLYTYNPGTLWFVVTFFAPVLVAMHVMIIGQLMGGDRGEAATQPA